MRKKRTPREKLAEMLSEALGIIVLPEDIRTEPERYSRYNDVCAWEGSVGSPECREKYRVPRIIFSSWETMTRLARTGITVEQVEPWAFDVSAKEQHE